MKAFCFVFLLLGIIACKKTEETRDELVRKNAEAFLQSSRTDSSSYEFVSLQLIDSTLYRDNIRLHRENFMNLSRSGDAREREKSQKLIAGIDAQEKSLGPKVNEVASYKYLFSYRTKNTLGTNVLSENILQTDPAPPYKVINLTSDESKVLITPNDFPGYKEMISKYP